MADEILIMMRHGCRTHKAGHEKAMKEFPAVNSETGAATPRIAVLLPCYNEAGNIEGIISSILLQPRAVHNY